MQIFGVLLKHSIKEIRNLRSNKIKVEVSDFVLFPVNASKLIKTRHALIMSKTSRGRKLLEKIDSEFIKEIQSLNLNVVREEFTQ